ncbi:hypothetical protein JANAI62_25930 [Jannaschia pagri]|uniref:SnoaL-like domain-containing protein n=1 Tax=Jannaschia pagri TaxID=2829797 RepID=A0ABQ4NNW5_9RHOB|nr:MULTISPECIES: nuclear transport factor 2 family protein [unclassified Jannaschia]GIT92135.1 hypothetical protein JANAI61_25930 [Jannaschia sp. AI_61]GIT95970.1 hypothetical protein JANAI62_25930 [Jannaschia sp. AI_62]
MTQDDDLETALRSFLDHYNQCFYDRDLEALRALYLSDDGLVFWDNHAGCDSTSLEDHVAKVSTFFATGKTTESGTIEPLLIEDLRARRRGDVAVLTSILRYRSAPRPGVRSTFVLGREGLAWRIMHVHHSFDPNETDQPGADPLGVEDR